MNLTGIDMNDPKTSEQKPDGETPEENAKYVAWLEAKITDQRKTIADFYQELGDDRVIDRRDAYEKVFLAMVPQKYCGLIWDGFYEEVSRQAEELLLRREKFATKKGK